MFFVVGDEDGKEEILRKVVDMTAGNLIEFCWFLLPPGRRNLSGLKEELNVVIERTIPQTEEGLKMIDVSSAEHIVQRFEGKSGRSWPPSGMK